MAMELEIASNEIKTNKNIKFKYESVKLINEVTTNYNHKCNRIELKKWPKIEKKNQIHKKLYN